MAVIARDSATLAFINEISYMRRYYLVQASNLAAPTSPTANPAPSPWSTTEPAYTAGSTNTLYVTDLIVFSDGTFDYLPVQKSSSYEAAKQAYNLAQSANNAAGAADTKATTALTSANGRNSRIYSTGNATGTTNPNTSLALVKGDTWDKWDSLATRNVIASWTWDGSAWQPTLIKNEMLHSLDVNKLLVSGSARIVQAVIDKIVADIGYYNSIQAGSVIATSIASAIATIVEARVEKLVVTSGATINFAVVQKLAASIIESQEFRTTVNASTGLYSIMDNNGYRLVDSTGETVINLGPSGDNLMQLGTGSNTAIIDSSGNISSPKGSFTDLWVGGQQLPDYLASLPRGVVSQGLLFAGKSRNLNGRDSVLGLEATLKVGRVYKIQTSQIVVETEHVNVIPFLQMHRTIDGSWPGTNWGNSAVAESIIGPYGGFRTLPPMTYWVDLRNSTSTTDIFLRSTISLANFANNGWCRVAATVNRCHMWVEDMGTQFADRGSPYFDAVGGGEQTPKVRTTSRWYATGWATWTRGGGRDTSVANPVQGQYSTVNRESAFFFDDMTATLAGKTIHRITLRTVARHWYGTTGTGRWHWHGMYGSIPSSSGLSSKFMVDTGGWPRGAAREINIIPSEFPAWQNGSRRGFGFSTASTGLEYYGYYSPNTGPSGDTWIEVDYEG